MKVENTVIKEPIYQPNQHTQKDASQESAKEGSSQLKNGTIFAGNLNLIQDPIAQKREEARKEALGLISKQFQSDMEIDTDMEERNHHIDEIQEENQYASAEIGRLREDIERFKKEYGLEDNSPEIIELRKQVAHWKYQIYEGEKEIRAEVATVRATKEVLLKRTHDMTDAASAAETIMESASDEIMGMLAQEAVEKMDEERKEEEEKIEEAREKKEEQEELIEKRQEQELLEEMTKEVLSADSVIDKEEIQREVEEILAKQKLLQEDIKGVVVDRSI